MLKRIRLDLRWCLIAGDAGHWHIGLREKPSVTSLILCVGGTPLATCDQFGPWEEGRYIPGPEYTGIHVNNPPFVHVCTCVP
jgi:hypothetical protein